MILQIGAAGLGTAAFALLFGVPRRYYPICAVIGAAGWALYSVLIASGFCGATAATFFATVLVMIGSRFCAVWQKCPATVFIVTGIFPLVPGAGIYWTAYNLVMGENAKASMHGAAALKAALAIVFGIVLVLELPNRIFHPRVPHKIDKNISK